MKDMNTKELTKLAILIALTTVMTMLIQIPTIGTNGYLNLGDMVVFLGAMILGRRGGFIVGGLGSALADLLLGYAHYAPITFLVKGMEGYIAGILLENELIGRKPIIATVVGGLWMAGGYYLAEIFIYGAKAALVSLPGNLMQGLLGGVSAVALFMAMKKSKLAN